MNIVVMSPHQSNNGNTTIACMLAMDLASRGRKVCLTNILAESKSLHMYLGLEEYEDKTVNPSRLVKMLREDIIKPEEVCDYCRNAMNNLDVFSVNKEEISNDDMLFVLGYIVKAFPHEFVVYDMDDYDLKSEANRLILERADVIILNITQSINELRKFRDNKQQIIKSIGRLPQLVVVNEYSEIKGSIKETAAMMGVKRPNGWHTVRYNSWITYGTNNGKMKYIFDKMVAKDYRVADISSDIKILGNSVLRVKVAKRKLEIQNKNMHNKGR